MSACLLAAKARPLDERMVPLVIIVFLLLVVFTITTVIVKYYKRCPSNRIMVIYGKTSSGMAATCVHGGAHFVLPLFQDYAWLSLEPMRVEIAACEPLPGRKTEIRVPRIYSVAIGTTPELMQNAAKRLLGLSAIEFAQHAEDIIVGQRDQLIAKVQTKEAGLDEDEFLELLRKGIEPVLRELGLVLISFRRE